MRIFHVKTLRLFLSTIFLLPGGVWLALVSVDAALSDSFWGTVTIGKRVYSIMYLLYIGTVGAFGGGFIGQSLLTNSAIVNVSPEGLQRSPMMSAPMPWDKISGIQHLKSTSSRFLRKGAIIVTVPDRSNIVYSDWLARLLHWSRGQEATIVIYSSVHLRGDQILNEIAQYYPNISSSA